MELMESVLRVDGETSFRIVRFLLFLTYFTKIKRSTGFGRIFLPFPLTYAQDNGSVDIVIQVNRNA